MKKNLFLILLFTLLLITGCDKKEETKEEKKEETKEEVKETNPALEARDSKYAVNCASDENDIYRSDLNELLEKESNSDDRITEIGTTKKEIIMLYDKEKTNVQKTYYIITYSFKSGKVSDEEKQIILDKSLSQADKSTYKNLKGNIEGNIITFTSEIDTGKLGYLANKDFEEYEAEEGVGTLLAGSFVTCRAN